MLTNLLAYSHQFPHFRVVAELCSTLVRENDERLKQVNSLENRVSSMLKLSLQEGGSDERQKAMDNLIVLCRDSEAGANRVWQEGKIVPELLDVIRDAEKFSDELALRATRVLDELAKKRERVGIFSLPLQSYSIDNQRVI